ncbi:MAG: MFS transporter [Pseudomonadota bacterium]
MTPAEQHSQTEPRTPQQYIDEVPMWADGTRVAAAHLTGMQIRIWVLAAAGKFFEGMVVFVTGLALPLIAREFSLDVLGHSFVGSAILAGILVGATSLGGMADRFGRKRVFVGELILFMACLVALAMAPSFPFLLVSLFAVGVALGGDYPTAHLVISESMPSRNRGRLVLGAFGFQAVGALFGVVVGYAILSTHPDIGAWRLMYASAIVPAALVVLGRLTITESPHWLLLMKRHDEANAAAARLLKREPLYPKRVTLRSHAERAQAAGGSFLSLFTSKNRRATVLASVPWFLQDLGTYGIGIFTPTILAAALGHKKEHATNVADLVSNDILSARGAAFVDIFLIVGILFAVLLVDRVGRIKLQVIGFVGCALGLAIAAASYYVPSAMSIYFICIGFVVFNFMTNMGPNAQTYLLAGEVFPLHIRGRGAGFAASFAKIGAVTTAFLFPILLAVIGVQALLGILIVTSLLGAAVTLAFRIETTGVDLDHIEAQDPPMPDALTQRG